MRYVLSVSVLFLAGLVPAFGGVDNELLAMAPPGSRLITSVDVAAAKNSQFGEYVLGRINTEDHSFEDLTQQTGFDPRRDVQDFVFASPGPGAAGAQSKFALLVRGHFDQERIRAAAKAKGATLQNYQGANIFMGGPGNRENAFAFVSDDIAVLGDLATVQQILANRASQAALDPAVQQLIAAIGPNNDMWFVSTMPGSFLANHVKQHANSNVPVEALDSILQSSGGIQFGDAVRLSFNATARSAKDAQSLVDVIHFVGSMVQMSRQKGPAMDALATAVDQMTVQTDGDAMHATLSLPEKSLEQLADMGIGAGHAHRAH